MAEYYPLISRAVAGLRTATPAARTSIYNRARSALVGQLRTMDPPIPEEAIEREVSALDEAIARVEADLSPATPPRPELQPAAPVMPTSPLRAMPRVQPPPTRAVPTLRPPAPSRVPLSRASEDRLAQPPQTIGREVTAATPRPALPPLRPSASRPAAPKVESGSGDAVVRGPDLSAMPTVPPVPGDAAALPSAPTLKLNADEAPRPANVSPGKAVADTDEPADEGPRDASARQKDDSSRPAAPRPIEPNRSNLRVWIVAIAALAAVIVIAFTAWRLRDNPQELARVPAAATPAVEPVVGKIVERADAPSASTDNGATTPPVTSSDASNSVETTAGVNAPVSPTTTSNAMVVPVAYKAAILVEATDEPQKVKTFVGTVIWRNETVSQGQDQPISQAIRAEIDIPDAKVKADIQIRRNTEAQFPASHTIDLKFIIAPDSPLGGVKQINVPQLRRDDMPTGDPLSGIPVTITDNYFLVGLTRGDAEQRNLDLIRTRGWFDIPLLLTSGKASKITFEKGASGEQIFNDVLQSWKTSQN